MGRVSTYVWTTAPFLRDVSVFYPLAMAALSSAVGGELHLDSWVTAHLLDGSSHRGVLHTVDPETGTVILLKPEGVSACEPHCDACAYAAVLTWLSSGVRSPSQTS